MIDILQTGGRAAGTISPDRSDATLRSSLVDIFRASAARVGDRIAIDADDGRLSYADLALAADGLDPGGQVAAELNSGGLRNPGFGQVLLDLNDRLSHEDVDSATRRGNL